jgi:hypothetical protein
MISQLSSSASLLNCPVEDICGSNAAACSCATPVTRITAPVSPDYCPPADIALTLLKNEIFIVMSLVLLMAHLRLRDAKCSRHNRCGGSYVSFTHKAAVYA